MSLSGRRGRLRGATAEAHAQLDAIVDTADFFGDRDRYAGYLKATLCARAPIEQALGCGSADALLPSWPHRIIGAALRADLTDVTGGDPPAVTDDDAVLAATTPAQIMGVIYVLEGSALGARVLVRRAAALGMSAGYGARHLALQTSNPAAWPAFLSALEAATFDTEQEAACARAAKATFARFQSAYRKAALSLLTQDAGA